MVQEQQWKWVWRPLVLVQVLVQLVVSLLVPQMEQTLTAVHATSTARHNQTVRLLSRQNNTKHKRGHIAHTRAST